MSEPLGVYIHVPFCKSRCSYCDFATGLPKSEKMVEEYLDLLVREICAFSSGAVLADTLYFGGGTPSYLTVFQVEKIKKALFSSFSFSQDLEWSMEMNPEGVEDFKLASLLELGVNRVSLGIQSLWEKELKILGRSHLVAENLRAIRLVLNFGLRFNVDLMLGIPLQTKESLLESLKILVDLGVSHLSLYMLSIEPGSLWFSKVQSGAVPLPEEEFVADLYEMCIDYLSSQGIFQYEISAFSRHKEECRHNLKYWNFTDWIGFGPSAANFFNQKRFSNPEDFFVWKEVVDGKKQRNLESLTRENRILDTIMLKFRLNCGICCEWYKEMSLSFPSLELESRLLRLLEKGLLESDGKRVRLTRQGLLLANLVFMEYCE